MLKDETNEKLQDVAGGIWQALREIGDNPSMYDLGKFEGKMIGLSIVLNAVAADIERYCQSSNGEEKMKWDDPPVNDWTPEKTGLYMWNCHDMTVTEIANKIAELEKAACAEVVNQMMEAYGKEYQCEYETLLDAKVRILARTNENAGYPRMDHE